MRTSPSPSASFTFVGRDRERGLLREHLDAAMAGRGSLVLIGGEAGIGKTALAAAFCADAGARGVAVLTGHCYDLAETPPYGPFIDLFLHLPSVPHPPPLPAAFAERGTVGAVTSQMALFAQVEDFLRALAAHRTERPRPVVIFLDDLHWADRASLDLLRFLARSIAALPLVLLATYRSDELTRGHPLSHVLPQLAREPSAVRLDLNRLDDATVRALVDARYGLPDTDAARLVAYLQTRAEGNALFVGELLRALEEMGAVRRDGGVWRIGDLAHIAVPSLLRQVIDTRYARLDAESQRLLAVAAVIGHEVPLAIWATVGAADETAMLAAVERGLETHLLNEAPSGERVQFAHALVREALYEGIPAIRRRHLHARTAEALKTSPGPDPDAVAYHLQQAGDARAGTWLMEAGERAQRAWAWLAAADRFEAALALMGEDATTARERGWLTFRLAVLRRYGDPERALAHLDVAGRLAAEVQDALLDAQVRFRRGHIRCLAGDPRAGLDEMAAGIAVLEALPPIDVAARPGIALVDITEARVGYYSHLGYSGHFAEAQALGERVAAEAAAAAPDGINSIQYGTIVTGLAPVYAYLGKAEEAHQLFAKVSSAWRAVDFLLQVGVNAMFRLIWETLPYRADDVAERRRLATDAEEAWARGSGGRATMPDRFARTPVLFVEGQWGEARTLALAGYRESGGYAVGTDFAFTTLGPLAAAQGDRELAEWLIGEWLPEGPATPPGGTFFTATILQRTAAALAIDAGGLETARAWLAAQDHWFAWSGAVLGQAERHLAWAHYHRAANDMAVAVTHAEEALACASDPRQPLALIAAHRMLGELDTTAGRYEDAARHLGASLALAEACEAPYERALTLLAEAALRAQTGERDMALRLLDDVHPTITALGAKPALARADALMARLDTTKERAPAYPAGLSIREVEVLRLVADGLSNADIADRLFLSKRTVQVHVAHILQKTGAENRAGAAAFALRHGLA
jgi:DNA-binding CsgD family transcriptional regulator